MRTRIPLSEARTVIVGGTSGIGIGCAYRLLLNRVPQMRLVGRSAQRGAEAVQFLRGEVADADVEFLQFDCSDPEAAEAMAAAAVKDMGGVDLLITSAGGNHLPELLFRTSMSEVADIITQDLLPHVLSCRAVLPAMMQAEGGVIVTVASDAAKVPTPGESVIGAVMAGIVQFTRGIAIEGKRNGIRANCVTPSLVEGTPLTDRLMAEGTFSSKLFAKARPLAELGPTTTMEVADLVLFLASPASKRITGQAISINGGISAA